MRPGYDVCWLTNGVPSFDHLAHEADILSKTIQEIETAVRRGQKMEEKKRAENDTTLFDLV